MLIGYARVSTQDQNLELQRKALLDAGCKKIFDDKLSGSRSDRPGLAQALAILRDGDTLVVWKLDRLGRSVKHMVDLVGELREKGIQLRSLTDSINTATPSGRFFFHVMASLAEMERELTVERTKAGLEVARSLGHWGQEAPDDRQQNRVSEEAVSQWGTASGCGQESRGVGADALPVSSGFFPVIQHGIMELNVY
jgi:DNA invertase Pin-like site-specific DNA recombinase